MASTDKRGDDAPERSTEPRIPRQPWRDGGSVEIENRMRLWGILIFGVIGATATAFAITQLRRTMDWFYNQLNRSTSSTSWRNGSGPGRKSFTEEALNRYNRRVQEEYEEDMERVERIRRMQSVFNRERNKYRRSYENWRENDPGAYQHFQRDDWYWADTSYKDQTNNPRSTQNGSYAMSHHYAVLGLDSLYNLTCSGHLVIPIHLLLCKTAFRTKAKEYHPNQNQSNKEAAETKFKEVMTSYEAIKVEIRNGKY